MNFNCIFVIFFYISSFLCLRLTSEHQNRKSSQTSTDGLIVKNDTFDNQGNLNSDLVQLYENNITHPNILGDASSSRGNIKDSGMVYNTIDVRGSGRRAMTETRLANSSCDLSHFDTFPRHHVQKYHNLQPGMSTFRPQVCSTSLLRACYT